MQAFEFTKAEMEIIDAALCIYASDQNGRGNTEIALKALRLQEAFEDSIRNEP